MCNTPPACLHDEPALCRIRAQQVAPSDTDHTAITCLQLLILKSMLMWRRTVAVYRHAAHAATAAAAAEASRNGQSLFASGRLTRYAVHSLIEITSEHQLSMCKHSAGDTAKVLDAHTNIVLQVAGFQQLAAASTF